MIEKSKLGFIGAGNMSKALIEGLAGQIAPGQITAADLLPEALESLAALGVNTSTQAVEAVRGQDLVVLGLKPQVATPILVELAPLLGAGQIIVSMMAGMSTVRIEELLLEGTPVVRVMPQTLVRLRVAACALSPGRAASS